MSIRLRRLKVLFFLGIYLLQLTPARAGTVPAVIPRAVPASAYFKMFSAVVNAAANPQEGRSLYNGFNNTLMVGQRFLATHGKDDPNYELIKKTNAKLEGAVAVWNQLKKGGCLDSENPNLAFTANSILAGVLAANPCQTKFNSALHSLHELAIDTTEKKEHEVSENPNSVKAREKKANFVGAMLRNAALSTRFASWSLDYTFGGKLPTSKTSGSESQLCKEFKTLAADPGNILLKPTDPTKLAQDFGATVKKTREVGDQTLNLLRVNNRTIKRIENPRTAEKIPVEIPMGKYLEQANHIFQIPGVALIAGAPAIRSKISRSLTPSGLDTAKTADCQLQTNAKIWCRIGSLPPIQPVTKEDVNLAVTQIKGSIQGTQSQIRSWENRLALLREEAKANSTPAEEQNKELDKMASEILIDRPLDFGAALLQDPENIEHVCELLKETYEHLEQHEKSSLIVHTGLAVGGVVATGASFLVSSPLAMAALAGFGAFSGGYDFLYFGAEARELQRRSALSQAAYAERGAQNGNSDYSDFTEEQDDLDRKIFADLWVKYIGAADTVAAGTTTALVAAPRAANIAMTSANLARAEEFNFQESLLHLIHRNPQKAQQVFFAGIKPGDAAATAARVHQLKKSAEESLEAIETSLVVKTFDDGFSPVWKTYWAQNYSSELYGGPEHEAEGITVVKDPEKVLAGHSH